MATFATVTILVLAFSGFYAAAALQYRQVEDDSCEALKYYAQNSTTGNLWVLDDVVVDENLLHVLHCNSRSEKESRLASDNTKWGGGVIPYVIDSSITNTVFVNDAIEVIEATTNIQMPPRTTESTYIRFAELNGNGACGSANIGKLSIQSAIFQYGSPYQGQIVSVKSTSSCGVGTAIHEIMHAAGVIHEHARDDRDTYVTINTACIQSGAQGNFNKAGSIERTIYDFNSVMHYSPGAFSTGGCNTIIATPEFSSQQNIMGKCNGISACDIAGLNRLYTAGQTGGTKTCTYECFCDYDFNALPFKVKNIGKSSNCGPNSLLNSWGSVSPSPPPPAPPPPNALYSTPSLVRDLCFDDTDKMLDVKGNSDGLTVTCALGSVICQGEPLEATLSEFVCPVTCGSCPMPHLPYPPSLFDGRFAWAYSSSINSIEFYLSTSVPVNSVTANIICVDDGFSLSSISSTNIGSYVEDFSMVAGLSGGVASMQFFANSGLVTTPLSPGDYVLGQISVVFESSCSDVVITDLSVIDDTGSVREFCGAGGTACFPDGVDSPPSPPSSPPASEVTGIIDFPICKDDGPITTIDLSGTPLEFACSTGDSICPGGALDTALGLNGQGAAECPITCGSCPVPFLEFIGDFDIRWSIAWDSSSGEGNFWINNEENMSGIQGQVECRDPVNNPLVSFSASELIGLPITINPLEGKFLMFSLAGNTVAPGSRLAVTFTAQFESPCNIIGVSSVVVSSELGDALSVCGVTGLDCLDGVPSPPVPVLVGDLDLDGFVNINDVVTLVELVTGSKDNVDPELLNAADINGDDVITVLDIISLIQIVVLS